LAQDKILGHALGLAPRDKIFKGYIELELQLGNIDRCRKLYEKYLEFNPANVYAWIKFAELEKTLAETDRVRAIYELAVNQSQLDMPELLWKSYIDFEIEEQETDKTRLLYERLLERTKHVKVWISYATLEGTLNNVAEARAIFDRADKYLKESELKEERVTLYESWKVFEEKYGDKNSLDVIIGKMPKRIKKRRIFKTAEGTDAGWEEYYDYVFPDDKGSMPNLKILELAHKWKKQKLETEQT